MSNQDLITIIMLVGLFVCFIYVIRTLKSLILNGPKNMISLIKETFSICIKATVFLCKNIGKIRTYIKNNASKQEVTTSTVKTTRSNTAPKLSERHILDPEVDYSIPTAFRNGSLKVIDGDVINVMTGKSVFVDEQKPNECQLELTLV